MGGVLARGRDTVLARAGDGPRQGRPWLWVGLLCLALIVLSDGLLGHERGTSGDEPFYERMASHPSGPHNFPYAYRIALPWLVHALPFSHVVSFTLLAWLAIAASGAVLYVLLMEFEIPPALAVALVLGFVVSPPLLIVLIRHGRSVDPASVLVITLGCLLIVRRQKLALGAIVLVGVTVRESSLFLLPLAYAVWAQRPFDSDALRDVAAVGALPLILYAVLRSSIDALGRQYIPGYSGPFLRARVDLLREALSGSTLAVELRRLAAAFGPLWLAAPFALPSSRFARRGLVLLVMCAISMTFAFDWGRIIFLAAPVVYVAGALVLRERRRLTVVTITALFALDLGYAIYMQAYGIKHGLDTSIGRVRAIPIY